MYIRAVLMLDMYALILYAPCGNKNSSQQGLGTGSQKPKQVKISVSGDG